jgi:hypothetical protein
MFTHDCVAKHVSNTIIKFADDTSGRPDHNEETAYMGEVREQSVWWQDSSNSVNVSKTKELIVDNIKRRDEQAPINIDGVVVERVDSF